MAVGRFLAEYVRWEFPAEVSTPHQDHREDPKTAMSARHTDPRYGVPQAPVSALHGV